MPALEPPPETVALAATPAWTFADLTPPFAKNVSAAPGSGAGLAQGLAFVFAVMLLVVALPVQAMTILSLGRRLGCRFWEAAGPLQ